MNLQEIKKEFSNFVDWYSEDRKTNEDLQSKINKVFDYIATKEIELAESRKEKCLEQNNDGTIRPCEVMKENEQLKEDVLEKQDLINDYVMDNAKLEKENADLQQRLDWAQGFLDKDVEYDELSKVRKENAELKIDMEIADSQRQLAEKENAELKAHCKAVDEVNEKMKNFYNCAHSSSALCPNGHNCKGCKDWELAE